MNARTSARTRASTRKHLEGGLAQSTGQAFVLRYVSRQACQQRRLCPLVILLLCMCACESGIRARRVGNAPHAKQIHVLLECTWIRVRVRTRASECVTLCVRVCAYQCASTCVELVYVRACVRARARITTFLRARVRACSRVHTCDQLSLLEQALHVSQLLLDLLAKGALRV